MAAQTCLIRKPESDRGWRSIRSIFGRVVMKCPRRQEGPGSPVSPGCKVIVVGASAIREEKGTISTVCAFSEELRWSRDTTSTQCRSRESPRWAVQISPRRGEACRSLVLFGIVLHSFGGGGDGAFQLLFFA